MNNLIKRVWNRRGMTHIEDLQGFAFSNESGGHTFQISGVEDGTMVVLSGTVAASFLRPDQATVAITGSISGGVVSVTLPANCYDIPGRFGLVIFLTSDSQKTAIYSCVGNVARSSTSQVAPGTTADVVDLINQINAAVATIPQSWTGLMADIAPNYSTSAVYPVGAYVYYNGDLYRCTTAITTAESWTAGHWTAAVLGNDVADLKSAIEANTGALTDLSETVIGIPSFNFIEGKILNNDGTIGDDATACVSEKIPYTWTGDTRYYCNDNTSTKYAVCFYDSSDNLLKKVQIPSTTGGVEYRAYNADSNVTGTISYVRFSFKKGTVGRCVKNQNPEPADYWAATATYSGGLVDDVTELQEIAPEPGQLDQIDEDLNGSISYNYETGKNLDSSGLTTTDNNSCVSEFIPYTWTGDTRYYYGEQSTGYRICYYDSTKALLNAFQSVNTAVYRSINAENSVTGTVAYVRFSFKKNTAAKVTKNAASELPQYWKAKTTVVRGLKERTSTLEKNTVTDFQSYVKSTSASLENGALTAVQNIDVRKNDVIECKGMITSFTSLTIGHGYQINHGMWAVIDGTNITTYKDESGTQVAQQAHGLTIGDYIGVVIKRGENSRADIELTSSSGRYVLQNVEWSANRGNVFATVSGTLTNVSLSYVMRDLNSNILVFGDSYQSFGDSARWPYYCVSNGFDKFLACGFPGANSGHEIISFRNLIELIKPKFVVWALGMNDSDSGAVNETWKACVDEVVATCAEYGITPILATIPCVPNRNHTYKNAYMKTLNKRYIDFAKAVNAESAGATWYTGMLSTDNLHPTALGAMALYSQVLEDFPEVMK